MVNIVWENPLGSLGPDSELRCPSYSDYSTLPPTPSFPSVCFLLLADTRIHILLYSPRTHLQRMRDCSIVLSD